jgi:hypothetical protein
MLQDRIDIWGHDVANRKESDKRMDAALSAIDLLSVWKQKGPLQYANNIM